MTRNDKADLQRKLAMAPVATPPAGLADRIKSDIPHLGFESERTNLRKSAMFNLRIAASIVLLVSSLYLVLHLLSRAGSKTEFATEERNLAPATTKVATLPNTPPEPGSARPQLRADLPPLPRVPPPTSIAAMPPRERIVEARQRESIGIASGQPAFAEHVETPAARTESIVVADDAPAPQAAPAWAPSPAVAQPAPLTFASGGAAADRDLAKTEAAPERKAAAAPAPELDRFSPAKDKENAAPPVRNFVAVQQAIARGETPRYVDITSIVQHFAAPERAPANLRVELEASATPLDETKWLLRVSVDAPAGTSSTIDLKFGDAIATHHALAGSPTPNTTALYEIEFKSDAKPDQTIATVRAGNVQSALRVADLHPWNTASPRMKRASLAAAWARTPQSKTQTEAIVAKAREAHIDELVDMAESAARIR